MLCENLKGDVWKKVNESILTPLYPFPAPTHTHTPLPPHPHPHPHTHTAITDTVQRSYNRASFKNSGGLKGG